MAFDDQNVVQSSMLPPLPERMRPKDLAGYVGQTHLVGEGCILRNMITSGNLSSFILWGPPGVGKTTLAGIIASSLHRDFYTLSAVSAGVKDVRDVIDRAKGRSVFSQGAAPILFIDEIHRFNKAQQDALLGAVENGTIVLIGATTENPSFEVITPLLSRCQVFVLKSLDVEDLQVLLDRALTTDVLLKEKDIEVKESEALFRFSGGDARKLLNVLEIVVDSFAGKPGKIIIDNKIVTECVQENIAIYDKDGEMHYDIISAFIKSIRGSDPNAAVYYLARMLDGGEDPLFIARRLCLSASEDVGLANPNALLLANACFQVVHQIGMPEARIPLAEAVTYIASAPKSNAAYLGVDAALADVRGKNCGEVPVHLRDAHYKGAAKLGHGIDYIYPHDYPGHFTRQQYLPKKMTGIRYYRPTENGAEKRLGDYLCQCWPERDGI